MDTSRVLEILAGGCLGAILTLLIGWGKYSISVRRELDSLGRADLVLSAADAANKAANEHLGTRFDGLDAKVDNLSNAVSRIEGMLSGRLKHEA